MMPNSTRNEPQELPRARYEDRQDGDARPLNRGTLRSPEKATESDRSTNRALAMTQIRPLPTTTMNPARMLLRSRSRRHRSA